MTIVRRLGFFSLLLGSVVCAQPAVQREGTLTICLVNPFGKRLPPGRLSVTSGGLSRYSADVDGVATVKLPYGTYTVTFEASWIEPARRVVEVDSAARFVVLTSQMEELEAPPKSDPLGVPRDTISVSLRARPERSCKDGGILWAKLVGAFTDQVLERRVDSYGYALFEPLVAGTYVLMVLDGDRVRTLQTVTTTRRLTVLQVPLSGCE
jgi:hypothetical protein